MADTRHFDALEDMVRHAEEAMQILAGRDGDELEADRRDQLALRHLVMIVGEAATNVPDTIRARIDLPWNRVVGMRNIVVHQYGRVDSGILAGIVHTNLPVLVERIGGYLSANP